jgi:hypothetical protein
VQPVQGGGPHQVGSFWMENDLSVGKSARPTYGWVWLAVPLALLAIYVILGLFDTSTEITPSHDTVLNTSFALGGLGAILLSGVAIFGQQKMAVWQRIYLAIALAILGFLSVFLLSNRIAELAENRADFPASSTRTYPAFLLIDRAYRTQGKGQSWNIQTMPIWSNLDITENDYSFMLHHRRPGDDGHNPDEISSKGYFCAQVTMQQSGSALRVLNAGSRKLPKGTVVICPVNGSLPPAH